MTFNISIEAEFDLDVEDIWPDGDAPENPTAEDVKMAMESCGSKHRVLSDWNLLEDLSFTVYGQGGHAQVWL